MPSRWLGGRGCRCPGVERCRCPDECCKREDGPGTQRASRVKVQVVVGGDVTVPQKLDHSKSKEFIVLFVGVFVRGVCMVFEHNKGLIDALACLIRDERG